MKNFIFFLLGIGFSLGLAHAAEPVASSDQLPRIPPTEADEAVHTFRIKKGFAIGLAASEPNVADPVSMSFDANGRLYVVEMIGYSERRGDKVGQVRLLEDVDGDGHYEKASVFAPGLAWPTAVFCYDGGVFVVVTPDLLYLKDTTGDGVADLRKVIYTGFGKGRSRLNMQALPNSLRWGLDNRIYGVTSSNGAVLTRPDAKGFAAVSLNGRDFSFDPSTLDLRPESGGGQHGATFDDFGRRFVSSNSNHLQAIVYDSRYAANPRYAMPGPRLGVAVDGSAAEVFRISPDEPWRIVRTRWRVASKVRGPVEGGGRVSGYFTAATGVTIYRGDAFGESFRGNAFVADAGSNLVHRKLLKYADGVVPKGERPKEERSSEFLASTDNWFRPVQLGNGPDGCLYILDMYREVIEHPWSLPQGIKKHLDLNSGNDRGRIWRILPKDFKRPRNPRLGDATTRQLVDNLSSPNAWIRETSSRLLFERRDVRAVSLLGQKLAKDSSHLGRLHAIHTLASLGKLKAAQILTAFADDHPVVREHAIRLAEPFLKQKHPEEMAGALLALSKDSSAPVRFQLALSLGILKVQGEVDALLDLLGRHPEDLWLKPAVVSALSTQSEQAFAHLKKREADPGQVLTLAREMQRKGSGLAGCSPEILEYVKLASLRLIREEALSPEKRLDAVSLLVKLDASAARKPLFDLLEEKSESLRHEALLALIRLAPKGLDRHVLGRWKDLSPRSRDEFLSFVLKNNLSVKLFLDAIEDGVVLAKELSLGRLNTFRKLKDGKLRVRAVKLIGPLPTTEKKLSKTELVKSYLPALELKGVASRGKITYDQRCSSCHRGFGQGFQLGPDLAGMKAAGPEKILTGFLDPSREIAADFEAYQVRTKDETLLGLLANETSTHLTIRFPFGKSMTVRRKDVKGMKSLGASIMPEGLEAGLDHQAVADLLAFVLAPDQGSRLPPFDLLVHRDSSGTVRPVRTNADWKKRRESILLGAEAVMGSFPKPLNRLPPKMVVVDEVDAGTYVRRSINYFVSKDFPVPAHLCIPKKILSGKEKAKAVLCLHPTDNNVGRKVVLGLGGRPGRAYAAELAERGFVTLSPAYPLLADYQVSPGKRGFESGTMMAIWDNSRGLDLLESLSFVDSSPGFGVIGHSLGGHNAIFTATFDKRLSVVAVSCSFDSFPDYYDGNEKNWVSGRGWCQTRYMPRMADYRGRLSQIPFDFPELLGALAPRPIFISAPKGDTNFRWKSTSRCAKAAAEVYNLLNAKRNLISLHPDCGHNFPKDVREKAYDFISEALSEKSK